jgi:nucleotide-binding universal stress UspA family protein
MSSSKILCAVDFSEGSEFALVKAAELACAFRGVLEIVHVFQVPAYALPGALLLPHPTFHADISKQAQKLLEDVALRLRQQNPSLPVTTHLLQGAPAERIVGHAHEAGAAMIVLGTHGRSGFRRFLLGSVAERVVRTADKAVLTVQLARESSVGS